MRKGLLLVVFIFLIMLAGLSWLVASSSGLRTAIAVAERVAPGLAVQQAEGRLLGPLTLTELHYESEPETAVSVKRIYLEWTPTELLKATLHINTLHITDVSIRSQSEQESTTSEVVLPEISLPLAVELENFELNNLQLVDATGQSTTAVNQLSTALTAEDNLLTINMVNVDTPDMSANLNGSITLKDAYPTTLSYELVLKQVLAEPLSISGDVSGDMGTLRVEQQIAAPLASIQQLELNDVVGQLRWSLVANAKELNLADIVPEQQTRLDALNVTAEGDLASLSAEISTTAAQPGFPALAVMLNAQSADLKTWQIAASASHQQSLLSIDGQVDTATEEPTIDAQLNWKNMIWPLDAETPEYASPAGQLSVRGTLSDYKADLATSLNWAAETIELNASTHGSATALTIDALDVNGFGGKLAAKGEANWETQPLQYQLNANWQEISLPAALAGKAIALHKGQIELDGNPEQLSLSTKTDLSVDGVDATVNVSGQGETASGFEASSLIITLADGSVSYDGPVRWVGESLLDGKLKLSQLNPGVLLPEWPGALTGQSDIEIKNTDSGIQVDAKEITISGELRQRPLSLRGAVSYTEALVDVSQLELKSGQSRLSADGQLQNNTLDFTWSLESPDLQDFYPDINGSMTAKGDVAGQLEQPAINADIKANNFAYQDIKIAKLDTQANVKLQENASLSANIQLSNIDTPQLVAESLSLNIGGTQQAHDVTLVLNSQPIQLAIKANGALSQEYQWRGSFAQFDFENAKAGSWSLSEKGLISASASQQSVPRHCWTSGNGLICLEANQAEGKWQTSGEIARLPLSLFEGFAVELEQLSGSLRGNFNLASGDDSVIRGKGELYVDDASLQLDQSALNQKKPLQLNNVSLHYQLDETETTAAFHLEPVLDGVSAIDASVQTAALMDVVNSPDTATLRGEITTAVKDLAALQLSHPAFDDVQGQLDINLQLAGTVAQPKIDGLATLQNGQVAVVDAGIVLREIEARVDGNLDQVDFDLQARSGDGTLTGEGEFKLTQQSWELTTDIKGRQLELMNTPQALVIAEPDLNISVTPTLTEVTGKVHIPQSELEPTEFNSAVSPSRDVVVVSDTAEAQSGAVTKIDVTVSLGDKVKLKAMGFQGRLTGDLRVFGKTSDILLANGEIKIKEGSYLAYGQLLHVDDGSIRFAGGAIDNPELDIKAVRKGKDYQAGLHIQGFASAPQANLFSNPDMSQDDVLSYILLGKPLAQASATDAAILASAATGMGLQNGAMLGDQIASTFGLDEFSIGGDSAENAALQVGKYLSPKLYLSYGIGVFESVSTVELRYELSKIWALKAESGTESGVDLLYTYERGKPEDRQ